MSNFTRKKTMFDTHNHCEFSCDSKMTLQQAADTAAKLGIGIILTEHWDYEYPTNPEQFLFDRDAYFKKNLPLRSDNVLLGIEVGMQPHLAEKEDKVPEGYPFDFVIGSIHMMNRLDLYEVTTYKGLSKEETMHDFLRDSIRSAESHNNFDTFGHIDYICRYWPYADKEFHMEENRQEWDRLFTVLIEKNKPIEINTRRLDAEAAVNALLPLYKRYKELGGKYCTLGSDAHYTEHIGRRLGEAAAIAKEAELQPVDFKERKMMLDR